MLLQVINANSRRNFFVFGAGGTVAGQSALVNDNISYDAAQIDIESLARNIQSFKPKWRGLSRQQRHGFRNLGCFGPPRPAHC